VEARYKKEYTITKAESAWLSEGVSKLQHLAKEICKKK